MTDLVAGTTRTMTAAYVVGCEGASSPVRDQIGVGLDGLLNVQNNIHVFFNSSELLPIFLPHPRTGALLSGRKAFWGLLTSSNWRGFGRFSMRPPAATAG